MTWEISLTFLLMAAALASFAWEKIPPDLTALAVFASLLATGLLGADEALAVFSNKAAVTVAAMFVLSAALERCGAIDALALQLDRLPKSGLRAVLFAMIPCVAVISAFINNTPVVVVFLPVVLSLARRMGLAASKLLIPLSYASILGGMCTLVGTSTNILVGSIALEHGMAPIRMFELAWVGIPVLVVGGLYLVTLGPRLLPVRETLSSILSEDERREYLTEAFVQEGSRLAGKPIRDTPLHKRDGIRVLEVVRDGVAVRGAVPKIELRAGDRLVLACRPKGVAEARAVPGLDLIAELGDDLETISASEGLIVEGVIGPDSALIGRRLGDLNFRQRFRMVVLAVHRRGRNMRRQLEGIRLEFGDTLLLLGSRQAVKTLQTSNDVLILDRPKIQARSRKGRLPLVLATIATVIGTATAGVAPIEVAAIVGCVFLFLTGCLTPREGYAAVQWPILFIIFGMLGLGTAMQTTGASALLADGLASGVARFVPEAWQPLVLLAGLYVITSALTEVLSNNAAAVLSGTLSLSLADSLGVDARPFLIAVAIAASASFATPIGYQTNTYVYGVGGYRFSDFFRIGVAMNVIACVITLAIVPLVWPFQPGP